MYDNQNGYQPRGTLSRMLPPNQGSCVQPTAHVTIMHSLTIHNEPKAVAISLDDLKRVLAKVKLGLPLTDDQRAMCDLAMQIAAELKEVKHG